MPTIKTRLLIAALLLLGLSGCFFISHNRTDTPEMKGLVGQRFATVRDGALIRDACLADHKAKDCQQLQILGGFYYARGGDQGWHQLRVPVAPDSLAAAIAAGGKLTPVPKGSVLTIVQIESKSLGEERRCWVIYAKMDMLPADTVAEIPSCFQWAPESSPMWFRPQELPHKSYEPAQYDYTTKAPSPVTAYIVPAN
ncbi:MAG TPA: hypothetical protein VGH91_13665 [Gammaproteobacteria bacterium]|jgi:hypothetical protein